MDVASLADLLHETAEHHDAYEKAGPAARLVGLVRGLHGRAPGRRGAGRAIRGRRALHGRRQAGGCLAGLTPAWLAEPETPPPGGVSASTRREEVAVNTIDTSPSSNGRGSDAWMRSWTHLGIDRRSPGYCRVTFDHPPINAITATTVAELAELVGVDRGGR